MSKGYRQRVGLAQAILHDPDVLILDEPTAGLDPNQIRETRRLIKDLAGTHTIILSTHILPEVEQTCEQVVVINKGRVVALDTPANLKSRLGGAETIRLEIDTHGVDPLAALNAVPGVTQVATTAVNGTTVVEVQSTQGADIRRELAQAVVSNGWGLLELRALQASLEEIFLELTTEDRVASSERTERTEDETDG